MLIQETFQAGLALLRQPVLPLVSMLQLLHQLDGQQGLAEIINALPEPLELGGIQYEQPQNLLRSHLSRLALLEAVSGGQQMAIQVFDESGQPADELTACTALIRHHILEDELERINSLLCAPCSCTLCCIGPDKRMEQEFFEIPLRSSEIELFPLPRHDTAASRGWLSMDEHSLQIEGRPFYQCAGPELFRWRNGWSLILPKNSACPSLDAQGRCRIYSRRPQVCRRPQLFSYVLETTDRPNQFCLRNVLLAVTDCPYVQLLREEIAAYAAVCELDLILKANKG